MTAARSRISAEQPLAWSRLVESSPRAVARAYCEAGIRLGIYPRPACLLHPTIAALLESTPVVQLFTRHPVVSNSMPIWLQQFARARHLQTRAIFAGKAKGSLARKEKTGGNRATDFITAVQETDSILQRSGFLRLPVISCELRLASCQLLTTVDEALALRIDPVASGCTDLDPVGHAGHLDTSCLIASRR